MQEPIPGAAHRGHPRHGAGHDTGAALRNCAQLRRQAHHDHARPAAPATGKRSLSLRNYSIPNQFHFIIRLDVP